jgi:hypothetical protein
MMLTQFSGNARKVIVSTDGVAAFNATWPCSTLRSRSYWFEFDDSGDLVDSDVPEHDDGPAAVAMADDCKAWLFDDINPGWAPDNDSPLWIGGDRPELEEPRDGLDSDDDRVRKVRDCVLTALDEAAESLYGPDILGATDQELPELFKAIDAQAGRMLERAAAAIREKEEKRNRAFRACPILSAYVSTLLQDLQLSEGEEACTEGREPRDSGTVYTLPDSEFEKCKQLCESFMAEHAADIEAATELEPGQPGLQYTASRYMNHERIGSTLYLAAVGHGVTFTDDGNAPCLERLANAARALRWESPYFGDDGRLYLI